MNLNKFIKMALKTGVYLLDQTEKATADMRERVNEQVDDLTDRTRQAFRQEDHTLRNAVSLAVGVGAGIALGMLFAPASGEETRSSIAEKVQDAGAKVRGRFSSEVEKATGTGGR